MNVPVHRQEYAGYFEAAVIEGQPQKHSDARLQRA
jgi:hypothetical protein